jgi:conjugal transfer pilus assembly protein TraB
MSNDKGEGLFLDEKPAPKSAPKAAPKSAPAAGTPRAKNVRKRWMYVLVAVVIFVVAISALTHTTPPPAQKIEKPGQLVNVTPPNIDQQTWQVKSMAHDKEMQSNVEKLQASLAATNAELQDLKKNPPAQKLPPGITAPPTMGPQSTSGISSIVPPPPVSSAIAPTFAQPGLPPISGAPAHVPSINQGLGNYPKIPALPPPYTSGQDSSVAAEPMVFSPDKSQAKPAALVVDGDSIDAKVKYKKNTQSGMMIAGAFAPVILLNGIEAGTSSGSRSNPLPVLIRVQDNATLPGAAKYQLKSCFMLGSGYGDLSAERVYIRLARLSCIDRDDRLVLSVPIQGYVVDSDNTLGMRGKVVDRQGARLGKALLAGFAQGLSGALGSAQGDVTSSALGSATSITGTAALRASGLSGISSASSQLAQFYLKEAEAIFPVIEIEGGRLASIVVSEDVNLTWGNVDEQFVREVTPTNKNN